MLQKKNENYEASAREISKQLKLKEAEVLPNAGKNRMRLVEQEIEKWKERVKVLEGELEYARE